MGKTELIDALHQKDEIILKQSKRIRLLEEKFTELRKKFFRMKYEDIYQSARNHHLA